MEKTPYRLDGLHDTMRSPRKYRIQASRIERFTMTKNDGMRNIPALGNRLVARYANATA
jgi:hypothetical protein